MAEIHGIMAESLDDTKKGNMAAYAVTGPSFPQFAAVVDPSGRGVFIFRLLLTADGLASGEHTTAESLIVGHCCR